MDAAKAALERDVASPLGLDPQRAAAAVLRVTTENMVAAIEEISINQGVDPRQATLIGGGGTAGLNAIAIARRLGCPTVIIPDLGAALSAAGALISKLSRDFTTLFATRCNRFDYNGVNHVLADLKGRCQEFIKGPGTQSLQQHIEFAVEARYAHQIWEIEVPLCTDQFTSDREVEQLKDNFHAKHHEIFAIEDRESEVELITWRAPGYPARSEKATSAPWWPVPGVVLGLSGGPSSSKTAGPLTRASTTSRTWRRMEPSPDPRSSNRPLRL